MLLHITPISLTHYDSTLVSRQNSRVITVTLLIEHTSLCFLTMKSTPLALWSSTNKTQRHNIISVYFDTFLLSTFKGLSNLNHLTLHQNMLHPSQNLNMVTQVP